MLWYMTEGGWPMWPVLAFGLVSIVIALSYAFAPRRELLPLVIGFAVATVMMGCVGTALDIQQTMRVPGDALHAIPVGVRESLNTTVLAFGIATLDSLIATIGAYRLVKASGSVRSAALA